MTEKCSWCGKKVVKPLEKYDAGNELHYFHPECWRELMEDLTRPLPPRR
jgi:hypothetical protein